MKELYTVGEVAKIFTVSTDTLRYYDRIGLLSPWVTGENGYRYYSKAQFEIISTIMLLRSMGTPIKNMYGILNDNTADGIMQELKRYSGEIDNEIRKLRELKEKVNLFEQNIEKTCYSDEIRIEKVPQMWMFSKLFGSDDELDIEEILEVNRLAKKDWSSLAGIVSTITPKNLKAGCFHTYERYGYISEIPCNVKSKYLEVIPSRECVVANAKVCTVEHAEIDGVYGKMLDFVKEKGLAISGDAIERNVLDLYAGNSKEPTIFFKIYIPVTNS